MPPMPPIPPMPPPGGMPGIAGFLVYSGAILLPVFVLVTFLFFD